MASTRKDKPLVSLECAGLSDALFESELFGHIKGAFTGAVNNKKGLVELANCGTLFLDEVGDIPLSMQVKLLRLIETGTFRRLGSAEVHSSDFRLICATHKNLYQMVKRGEFRTDLYYRINVFPIMLPSLSERVADIPLVAKALLSRIDPAGEYHFTSTATRKPQSLDYPGNIRELRNLISRALVMADTNVIDARVIELALEDAPDRIVLDANDRQDDQADWVDLKTHERRYLADLMQAHDGDKEEVAKILNISTRSLYRKLSE